MAVPPLGALVEHASPSSYTGFAKALGRQTLRNLLLTWPTALAIDHVPALRKLLFDKAVSAVEALPASSRPVSGFMAGAALLPLDARGRLVPEPFSWALMLAGLGLVGCAARRHQARINDRRSTL